MSTKGKLITKQVASIDHAGTGSSARGARIKSGNSLRSVARKMGYTAPYVSDLERGRRNWTEEKLREYNDAVGASWNEATTK